MTKDEQIEIEKLINSLLMHRAFMQGVNAVSDKKFFPDDLTVGHLWKAAHYLSRIKQLEKVNKP